MSDEIMFSDGSLFGMRRLDELPPVSQAEVLETFVLTLARAQRIAHERRQGLRPPLGASQLIDANAEIVRLSALANSRKANGDVDEEVERLVKLSQEEK